MRLCRKPPLDGSQGTRFGALGSAASATVLIGRLLAVSTDPWLGVFSGRGGGESSGLIELTCVQIGVKCADGCGSFLQHFIKRTDGWLAVPRLRQALTNQAK